VAEVMLVAWFMASLANNIRRDSVVASFVAPLWDRARVIGGGDNSLAIALVLMVTGLTACWAFPFAASQVRTWMGSAFFDAYWIGAMVIVALILALILAMAWSLAGWVADFIERNKFVASLIAPLREDVTKIQAGGAKSLAVNLLMPVALFVVLMVVLAVLSALDWPWVGVEIVLRSRQNLASGEQQEERKKMIYNFVYRVLSAVIFGYGFGISANFYRFGSLGHLLSFGGGAALAYFSIVPFIQKRRRLANYRQRKELLIQP
jgi:hypothetical protein